MNSGHDLAARNAVAVLTAAPWLWGYTAGPTANAIPLFFGWTCALLMVPLVLTQSRGNLERAAAAGWLWAASLSAAGALVQHVGWSADIPLLVTSANGEAFGNLRQRNQLGTLMAIGLAALLLFPLRLATIVRYLLAVLLAVASVATLSRTGMLLWLLVCAFAALREPGSRRLAVWSLLAYALGYFLLPQVVALAGREGLAMLDRLAAIPACSSRRVLWFNIIHLILQRPLTGWGFGEIGYAHYAELFPSLRFCDILDNAHNLVLEAAVDFGVPAAITGLILLALWLRRLKPWREMDAGRNLAWVVLGAIALHSLLEYPLWYAPFQLAALMALLILHRPAKLPLPAVGAATCAAAALLVLLCYVAWDYDRVSDAYRPPQERRHGAEAAARTVFFTRQAEFAELVTTDVIPDNAPRVHALALRSLHYSAEPRVITRLIESAIVLHDYEEARWHMVRFRAAFPDEYAVWLAARHPSVAPP